MELALLIIDILTILVILIGGWFIKNYFPSYMDKKGENLATKEDISEITAMTEEVQKDFKERFELFSSDVKFKYDYSYKQYSELYCKLYSIVIQSEYIRAFIGICEEKTIPFDDAPFLEISRETQKNSFEEGNTVRAGDSEEWVDLPLFQFNKTQLCNLIIQNRDLASQELLKLAVSYMFALNYYSGSKTMINSSVKSIADNEEFRLIREIVCMIVKDYNRLRKELKMSFNEQELTNGIPLLSQ